MITLLIFLCIAFLAFIIALCFRWIGVLLWLVSVLLGLAVIFILLLL